MASPSVKKIKAWSFSRYSVYQQCPLKAKLQFIDKLKEPPNEAMDRGNRIHELAEKFLKGELNKLPAELSRFRLMFQQLQKQRIDPSLPVVVEETWAFTKAWKQTRWDDWADCAVRVKLDCAHYQDQDVVIVTDWKTGKFRPDQEEAYLEQLQLYALAALLIYPHVKQVRPRLVYLDLGVVHPEGDLFYDQSDVPKLKKLWETRTKPMLADTTFAPRPNRWCYSCHFRKSNDGPCQY